MFDSLTLAQDDKRTEKTQKSFVWYTSSTTAVVPLFPAGKGLGGVRTLTTECKRNKFLLCFLIKKKPDRLAQPIFDGLVQCPTGFSLRKSVATYAKQSVGRNSFFVQFFGRLRAFLPRKALKKPSAFCYTKRRAQFLFVGSSFGRLRGFSFKKSPSKTSKINF